MPIRTSIYLLASIPVECATFGHRHQIANIPQPAILDLDHQWGDPSALSYAVLYETGVY